MCVYTRQTPARPHANYNSPASLDRLPRWGLLKAAAFAVVVESNINKRAFLDGHISPREKKGGPSSSLCRLKGREGKALLLLLLLPGES